MSPQSQLLEIGFIQRKLSVRLHMGLNGCCSVSFLSSLRAFCGILWWCEMCQNQCLKYSLSVTCFKNYAWLLLSNSGLNPITAHVILARWWCRSAAARDVWRNREALKTNWHGATVPSSGQNKKSHLFCFSLMPSVGFDHDTQAVLIIMDGIWGKRHAHTCPDNDCMRASKTGAHSPATHFQNCILKKKNFC